MQINSKAQIVFGIAVSAQQIEEFQDKDSGNHNIYAYNDLDENGNKILGLLVTEQTTYYSFSDSKKIIFLSPEKEKEVSELLHQHFQQQASYFLIASCS